MKRILVFLLMLLAFSSAPALAQALNPAAYLPSSTAAYIEIRTDEAGLAALDQLAEVSARLSGVPSGVQINPIDQVITSALYSRMPGNDARTDILPWLGDRIGYGMLVIFPDPNYFGDGIFVLPIADSTAARAFVAKVTEGVSAEPAGGVTIYKTSTYGMAVGADVIWLSTPDGIDVLLSVPMFQRLSDNPGYREVRAALPQDAPISGYVSGTFVSDTLNQSLANMSPDQPTPATIVEAALRLHPAQSAMEDALLVNGGLNGIGVALQVSDAQIDVTAIASVDATYPAPTLTTTTAGSALLQYVPGDSFLVFDSYDVSALALPAAALAYLGPSVGSTFTSITMSLGGSTPPPTPTPTPTPTPAPPPTANDLLAQVQPAVAQIESLMGMSLDDLYSLTNGEYAVAVFPGAGPTVGAALYVQSSDPQRLIDTLDRVSKLILIDPAAGTPLVGVEHQTISGVDVALLGVPGAGERPAIGILGGSTLFVTVESAVSKVISASTQPSATPALNWRDTFGEGQEALLYADIRTLDLYSIRQERVPPLPISVAAGSLDLRDDGLFVLRLALTVAP
jgi:hypothetical protein